MSFEETLSSWSVTPEIVKVNVDWWTFKSIYLSTILTPTNPNLLWMRIHDSPLVISSSLVSNNISVKSLWSNMTVLCWKNASHTLIIWRLNMLVQEEDSIKLWVVNRIVLNVVLIIIEIEEVRSKIHSSERVIWSWTPSTMNLHGSLGTLKHAFNICQIVCELNCVPEYELPRLAEIGDLWSLRVKTVVVDNHYLFSCRNSNLGHGSQGADLSQVTNVSKWLASFLSWFVQYHSWVLVHRGESIPVKSSKVQKSAIFSSNSPCSSYSTMSLGQFR